MSSVARAIAISTARSRPKRSQLPAPGTTSPGARRGRRSFGLIGRRRS
jgi:hypothetical protein